MKLSIFNPLSRKGRGITAVLLVASLLFYAVGTAGAASIGVQGYSAPGYLIDSKSDAIQAQAEYFYTLNLSDPATVNKELRFRLLDPAGNAVPLKVGAGAQAFLPVTDSFPRPLNSGNRTVNASLRPAARLVPGTLYRVEVTVVDYAETAVEAVGNTYVHFFENGGAMRLDAVAVAGQPVIDSLFLITSIAAKNQLRVTVPYEMHRFRDGAPAVAVGVQLQLELVDDLGAVIASQTEVAMSPPVAGGSGGPVVVSGSHQFEFPPGSQLDPVNRTYRVRVTANHNDLVGGLLTLTGNTAESAAERILHFNGVLRFGAGARQADAILTDVTNSPAVGAVTASEVGTTLVLAEQGAVFGVGAAYTFGNPAQTLEVALQPNGLAVYTGAVVIALDQPAVDESTQAGVKLRRAPGSLLATADGLSAELRVRLPAGMGWGASAAARVLNHSLVVEDVALNNQLLPSGANVAFAAAGWFFEESKPVMTRFTAVSWTPGSGGFVFTSAESEFVRGAAMTSLEAQAPFMSNPAAAKRRSNDHYYRAVTGFTGGTATVSTGMTGDARVSGTLGFGALGVSLFLPHFPYADDTLGTSISITGGQMKIEEDRVAPVDSYLSATAPFTLTFDRSCANVAGKSGCPGDGVLDVGTVLFTPQDVGVVTRMLRFTRDGGLSARGSVFGVDALLKWGRDPAVAGRYAQALESKFDGGGFHMPGHTLAGGMNRLDPQSAQPAPAAMLRPVLGAAAILHSGVLPYSEQTPDMLERPGIGEVKLGDVTYGYSVGEGDYAGLNLRVSEEPKQARSVIGDFQSAAYDLAAASKFYVRLSGVSGRHQALDFAGGLVIYGYDLNLTRYGLGYLSNKNVISITDGSISIPEPSDVTFPFEGMKFTCTGGIEDARIPDGLGDQAMLLGAGYWDADFYPLAYIFAADDPCAEAPKFGVFARAFCSLMPGVGLNGALGFETNGQLLRVSDGNSRLNSRLVLPSLCELPGPGDETWKVEPMVDAFFNHHAASPNVPGFLNVVGRWQLPFFRGTAITVHTSAKEEPLSLATEPYLVMSQHINITTEPLGDDPDHLGYPHNRTLAAFREAGRGRGSAAPSYTPTARALWLGVTNLFDFNIVFDPVSRSFTSLPSSTNLFVLSTRSSLELLTPRVAKLDFGLDYGIKRLDLTGFVEDATKRGTDWLGSLTDAAGDQMAKLLKDLFQQAEDYTKNNLERVVDRFLDQTELAQKLVNFRTQLFNRAEEEIDNLVDDFAEEIKTQVRGRVTQGMVDGVNDFLDRANAAAPAISNLTTPAGIGAAGRSYVSKNVPGLAGVASRVLTEENIAKNAPPGLDDLHRRANAIPGTVSTVQAATNNGPNGVERQIEAAIDAATPSIKAAIKRRLIETLKEWLVKAPGGGTILDLATVSEEEFERRLRNAIVRAIMESPLANAIRKIAHEKIDQVAELYREQFRGIQYIINYYVQIEAARHLGPVDKAVNGFTGPLRRWVGAGEITGSAEINGDVLRELRLDGRFQWKCPKNLEYKGSMVIKQLHTQTDGGACVSTGMLAHEITLTAKDVEVDFMIGDFKANVSGICIVESEPDKAGFQVKGLGGGLENTKSLTYEGFGIDRIGFGAMISPQYGAHIVGASRMKFGGYEVGGGLFFGSTCSVAPLAMIDPDFARSFGNPPFSGAYAFGMGRTPLIGGSCALRATIGVGAGFFYLLPGPTVGVRFTGEVSGEALCLVSVKGVLDILARYSFESRSPYAEGQLKLSGKAGKCRLCVKFGKTFRMAYDDGRLRRL
jgi:hypothetical protein